MKVLKDLTYEHFLYRLKQIILQHCISCGGDSNLRIHPLSTRELPKKICLDCDTQLVENYHES